ncbi:hypothetical protein AOLI_G00135930 [Acnodon oligacanthus]
MRQRRSSLVMKLKALEGSDGPPALKLEEWSEAVEHRYDPVYITQQDESEREREMKKGKDGEETVSDRGRKKMGREREERRKTKKGRMMFLLKGVNPWRNLLQRKNSSS